MADPDRAGTLLAEIAVLCSYIKRRKHLTLLADRDFKLPVTELERAFSESLRTLGLLDVRSTLYVDVGISMLAGKTAAVIFDFYESVIEADLEGLTVVQVSLANTEGLRLSLNVCCASDLSWLAVGGVRYEKDDDDGYQRLVFFPEGGAAK